MSAIWKPLKNFESTHLISNLGNIKRLSDNIILNQNKHSKGYVNVTITVNKIKTHLLVHRGVALTLLIILIIILK